MADIHRDLETSLTGRPPSGMGWLGWLAVTAVVLAGLGVAAGWMGYVFVRGQVERIAEIALESPLEATAQMLARMDPELELATPEGGAATILRDLRSGRVLDLQDAVEGSLRVRTQEGELAIDLRGDESGGSLVIDSPEGRVSAELSRDDEGGSLVIRSDGAEELRFGAGAAARPLPEWVPRDGSMPDEPAHVYSAGSFGAVAWETSRSPARLLRYFEDALEELGFDAVGQTESRSGEDAQVSIWATDEDSGRMAFVVAARENRQTSVVLGYGEER